MGSSRPQLDASPDGSPTGGWCAECRAQHVLAWRPARAQAIALAAKLERDGDLHLQGHGPREHAPTTESLFGEARGKMFGVLVALDPTTSQPVTLHAFSGQYEGRWEVPGWVGPLFNVAAWHAASRETEPQIKALSRDIASLGAADLARPRLLAQRRELSQTLMRQFQALYRLHNFRGKTLGLSETTRGDAWSTGTGDCCAPKLLNAAAERGLRPVALAEFFWGATNLSQARQHQTFYPACELKCGPLLGHLLCGADT